VTHQPLRGRIQKAALLLTGEGQIVVIQLPFAGDPHALLMSLGIEVDTSTPGYLSVLGFQSSQEAPAII